MQLGFTCLLFKIIRLIIILALLLKLIFAFNSSHKKKEVNLQLEQIESMERFKTKNK